MVNCPLDREQSKFYKENRYKFIETKKINRPLELAKLNYGGIPVVNLVKAVFYMYKAWNLPAPFFNAFFINLRIFLDWSIVFRHISIENYIYSNRETAQQSAINILLSKHGGESWSHTFSLGGTYLLSRNSDFKDYRNMVWSFLFFDHFVGMNQDTVEYYKLHYQKVRKYYVVGCPYSEMICKKNIELKKKEFLEKVFNINTSNRMKVVTFFDTTFDDSKDALTNYDDCRSFYEDILKLLDARKDILVFIKPSKRLDFLASSSARRFFVTNAQEILRLYNILGSHPRVFYNKSASNEKNALDFRFNNTFIAASDLVITHCLSSPTAEALGARKKAIWYESGDKHRGMMYDRIPGLCAHGFDELITRVDELLYKTTDKEYDEYLDRYIRGKVESHLDGLALTRFRQLLIDKNRIGSYT